VAKPPKYGLAADNQIYYIRRNTGVFKPPYNRPPCGTHGSITPTYFLGSKTRYSLKQQTSRAGTGDLTYRRTYTFWRKPRRAHAI